MNRGTIYNILCEVDFDTEVKMIKAWNKNSYSFEGNNTVTGVRICADSLVLDHRKTDKPLTVNTLLAIMNSFKGHELQLSFDSYSPAKKVSGVFVGDSVYLCANEGDEDGSD